MSFGTPPQTFGVVFDTGSFTAEVTGIQSQDACRPQRKFNYTASSTFVNLNKTDRLVFDTGGGVEPSVSFASPDLLLLLLFSNLDAGCRTSKRSMC